MSKFRRRSRGLLSAWSFRRKTEQRGARRRLFTEPLEQRELLAGDVVQNPWINEDVNASGQVSPLDALMVINALTDRGEGEETASARTYLDVNGDGQLSPLDALRVINQLLSPEGESGPVMSYTPILLADTVTGPFRFGADFHDNGAANDTIVRTDTGSWITDGFVAGGQILVADANRFRDVDVNRALFTYNNPKTGTDPQSGATVQDPSNGSPVLEFTDTDSDSQLDYPDPVIVDPDNNPNTPNSRVEFPSTILDNQGNPQPNGEPVAVGDFGEDQNFHNNGLFTIQSVTATTITLASSAQLVEMSDANASTTATFFRPISTVAPGANFRLGIIAEDLRPKALTEVGATTVNLGGTVFEVEQARGPFGAFVDLIFDTSLVNALGTNLGAINFHNFLSSTPSGSFSPGLVDEGGGVAFSTTASSPLGRGKFLAWETRFSAGSNTGNAVFGTNAADILPAHDSLLFGVNEAVPPSMIMYNTTTLNIASGIAVTADSATIQEDSGPRVMNVLDNDQSLDPPGAALTVTGVTQPTNAPGSVTFTSSNVTFTPPLNANGEFNFTYTVTNGTVSATGNVTVTVTPVNDLPVVTVPGARTVAEDNPLSITGLSVDEPDGQNVTMNLTVANGRLTPSASGATVTGSGTSSVSISGAEADVNQALNGLTYQPNQHFNGSDTLNITASDGTGSVPATVAITVTPVNDAPENTLPGDQTIFLGGTLTFSGAAAITVADVDSNNLNVTISVNSGSLSLGTQSGTSVTASGSPATINSTLTGLVFTPASVTTPSTAQLTVNTSDGAATDQDSLTINVVPPTRPFAANNSFLGSNGIPEDTTTATTLDVLANDLVPDGSTFGITQVSPISPANAGTLTNNTSNVSFIPAANFFGIVTFTYTLESNPAGDGPGVGTVSLEITAVNDPPSLTVPGAQALDEDTTLNLVGVSVTDIDAGAGTIEVNLSVNHGTLSAPNGSGSGGNLTLSGTLANVNSSLASLAYTPNLEFSGGDTLTITVDDKGNTGGGSLTDTKSVAITINAVNDAPAITVPGAQSFITEFDNPLTGPNAIRISDVDAGTDSVRVDLTIADGALTVSNTTGLTVTGNGTNAVVLQGTVSGINSALATLIYRTSTSGNKTLAATVNDQGRNGAGGAKSATGNVSIEVLDFVPVDLTGVIFIDSDEDGIKDPNEPGLGGVDVRLTGTDFQGNPVDVTVTTDSNGRYVFEDMRPNEPGKPYKIEQVQPAHIANPEGESNVVFIDVDIRGNVSVTGGDLNFSEGGFMGQYADVWSLFASSGEQPTGIVFGMDATQSFSIFLGSWDTNRYANARFTPSANGNSGVLTVFDRVLGRDRSAHVSTEDGTLVHRGTGVDKVYRVIGGAELLDAGTANANNVVPGGEGSSGSSGLFARAVDSLFASGGI